MVAVVVEVKKLLPEVSSTLKVKDAFSAMKELLIDKTVDVTSANRSTTVDPEKLATPPVEVTRKEAFPLYVKYALRAVIEAPVPSLISGPVGAVDGKVHLIPEISILGRVVLNRLVIEVSGVIVPANAELPTIVEFCAVNVPVVALKLKRTRAVDPNSKLALDRSTLDPAVA